MNTGLDPEASEAITRVKRAIMELKQFAMSHTIDPALGKSIEALVAAGALSPETAAFFADHVSKFYGFASNQTGPQVPVFEVVLVGRPTPIRSVAFADGHTERVPLERQL